MEKRTPLVRVNNLCKSFGNGLKQVEALKGISLDIYEQEFIAVLGASGAGKSTLLHILGTLDRPSRGNLYYREDDVFSWSDKKLARFRNRTVGFVFQGHHLLPEFTALENTMMPALIRGMGRKTAAENAEALLVKMGLKNRMYHKSGELSGGEQQRVALARALILKPEIILADEPTGNLDSQTGNLIYDLLFTLNRNEKIAMVVVTHNEALTTHIPRRIILHDGQKTSDTLSTETVRPL